MKNQSTHSGKGVAWGHACKQPTKEGYNQIGGEGHSSAPSSKFIGETKGNRDLPTNRS